MNKLEGLYPKDSSPCNCMNIRRATKAITQVYDSILAPSGVTITQMGILLTIKMQGVECNITKLAEALRSDRTTMNRNLKPLLTSGIVEIVAGKDARSRRPCLTDKGETTLTSALALWEQAQEQLSDYLGKDELTALRQTLAKIEALVP